MPAAQVVINHDPKPVRLDKPDMHVKTIGPRYGTGSSRWHAVWSTLPVSESNG
jgi:3-isopropylmalate dehydratase small subunit